MEATSTVFHRTTEGEGGEAEGEWECKGECELVTVMDD